MAFINKSDSSNHICIRLFR